MGDDELVQRARDGDTAAFGELWSRHSRAGLTAARQFSNIADPDDIVAEAYLRILRAIQNGGGPREGFRPYLYRTIRNVALGWADRGAVLPLDEADDLAAPGDLEATTLENTITVKAFRTLPERWQTILWYTEVEGMDPAEAAPHLGLTANAAAALAYRARDGLKKAWLQAHVNDLRVPEACRWTTQRMADYNRGALSATARERFDDHLRTCTRCSILVEEIDNISGRLAAILFPIALGGTAGAGLLAELIAHGSAGAGPSPAPPVAAAANGPRVLMARGPARAVAIAAGAAVAIAASTGIVYALSAPASAPDSVRADAPTRPQAADPTTTTPPPPIETPPAAPAPPPPVAPPAPPAPAPSRPIRAVVVPVVPPVPDTVPPAAALITSPADGALIATATPALTGTGEPGARVEIDLVRPDGSLEPAGSGTVGADGTWTATTSALPDGAEQLRVTLVDAAGNRSPAVDRALTVDTVALPPTVDVLPPGPLEYLPTVTGRAEPDATVTLLDAAGTALATVTASDAGAWSVVLPDPTADTVSVTATQRDPAGNVSAVSDPVGTSFDRPTVLSPADGAQLPSAGAGGTVVEVDIAGISGEHVEIAIDGVWTGNIHTLDTAPIARVTPALGDGAHTIAVRYIDQSTGRRGATTLLHFVIG